MDEDEDSNYMDVTSDEWADVLAATLRSLKTRQQWGDSGTYVVRYEQRKNARGQRQLRLSMADGDVWIVAEKD